MRDPAPANFELSIVLPLAVIANQLSKVETDLRFLSARTSAHASGSSGGDLAGQAAARLEKIHEALEIIGGLVSDIETYIQPGSANAGPLKVRTDRDD